MPEEVDDAIMHQIDVGNEAIEHWYLQTDATIENFVTADYPLVARTLAAIIDAGLIAGTNFCELGCGFGIAVLIAESLGLRAFGIEVEQELVQQAEQLFERLASDASVHHGSFVPRDSDPMQQLESEVQNVTTEADDLWRQLDVAPDEVDLYFAFPWPGEEHYFETFVDNHGSDGALLLTYRGREGMRLQRKVSSAT